VRDVACRDELVRGVQVKRVHRVRYCASDLRLATPKICND
jgi:hypothetical protein